jgi:tetratricopeptide (TPR) repeat protein
MVLAEASMRLREPEQAAELLDSLPFATPQVAWRLRARAVQLYLDLGRRDTAREIANAMLAEQPTNRTALANLIAVENNGGDLEKARAALDHAIEISPDDAKLYRMRGNFFLSFRRARDGAPMFPNDAQEDLIKARELDPADDRTHFMIGQLREAMGNERLALASFDKAIELNRDNVEAYLHRGQILERQGRLEEAIENYGQVVEAASRSALPDHRLIIALNNLAWLLADESDPTPAALDRALELAQEAKEITPKNPTVADTLGWVMHKRDVYPVAITLFREAIANYQPGTPNRALTRYHLALSYEANGEPDRAVEELRAALGETDRFPKRDEATAALKRLTAS